MVYVNGKCPFDMASMFVRFGMEKVIGIKGDGIEENGEIGENRLNIHCNVPFNWILKLTKRD